MALALLVTMPRPHEKVLAAAIVVLPSAFFYRMSLLGAHFRPDELRLVRTFSTTRLTWSRVSRFLIAPRGIQPLAVFVETTDGDRVWIEGMGPWFRFTRSSERLEEQVREMNEELARIKVA